eukprot:s596_g8.t1
MLLMSLWKILPEVAAAVRAAVADAPAAAADPSLADVRGDAELYPADVVGDAEQSVADVAGDAALRAADVAGDAEPSFADVGRDAELRAADVGGDAEPTPLKPDLVSQIAELKKRRTMLAQQKRENARNLKNKEKRLKRVKQTLKKFDQSSLKELLDLKVALKK